MTRLFQLVALGSVACLCMPFAGAQSDPNADARAAVTADLGAPGPDNLAAVLPPLPPLPRGTTTVIGGVIHKVDPVQDQLVLDVFGSQPMKILYDVRTRMYRDGKKIPIDDLRTGDHASVETVLDGDGVFAQSIHMLSQAPTGQCQGQVVNYDPGTRQLTVRDSISQQPVTLAVPANASIARVGQRAFVAANLGTSDLQPGSLVTVQFDANNQGGGVASQITILATPGASFLFTGTIVYLDTHSSLMVVHDPQNDQDYRISFDPALFPVSRDLHEGSRVMVRASFYGSRYVAGSISLN